MKKDVLTTFEISRLLHVNPTTVQNWTRKGMLPFYTTPGGHRRVRLPDLLTFIDEYQFPLPEELKTPRRRVLIVDDEPSFLEVVKQGIMRTAAAEWEVFTSPNGIDALMLIGDIKPHLVLLDILLPDIDGFEVCRRIKERAPSTRIISMSGNPAELIAERILAAGADRFIPKPFTISKIVQVMRKLTKNEGFEL